MKKYSYLKAALCAVIVGVSALTVKAAVPEPVALWDKDFTSLTSGDCTIELKGNIVSDDKSYIEIKAGTNGVEVDWPSGVGAATVIFRCENVPQDPVSGKNQCFATIHNTADLNRLGVTRISNGNMQAIWSNTLWSDSPTPEFPTESGQQLFALGYQYNTGTIFCTNIEKDWTTLLDASGLGSPAYDNNTIIGFSILGYRGSSSNMSNLEGAKVTGIAIFKQKLTATEIAAAAEEYLPKGYVQEEGDVISINFANNGNTISTNQETFNGTIPPEAWSIKSGPSGDGIAGAKIYSVGKTYDYPSLICTWYFNLKGWGTRIASLSANDGDTLPDAAHAYMKEFFTRGDLNKSSAEEYQSEANIQISEIPFYKYDLYIYFNGSLYSDQTTMSAFDFKGTRYTVNGGGVPITGSGDWGHIGNGVPIYGDNVVKFTGLTDKDLAFHYNGHVNRMGIAAIQIVNTVSSKTRLILDDNKTWTELLAGHDEPSEDGIVEITVTGDYTLTLDKSINCARVAFSGEKASVTSSSKPLITKTIEKLNAAKLTDSLSLVYNVMSGYTVPEDLRNIIKGASKKLRFVFKGAGESGATLDYGTAHLKTTLGSHIVFDGGEHTLQMCNAYDNDGKGLKFGANATANNPTIRVMGGAYLTFKAKDPCGWESGQTNANGIIRVDDESTLEMIPTAGTCYWAQQIYLEPGATLVVNDNGTNFRVNGGTNSGATAQIYVPDSISDMTDKSAKVTQLGTGGLYVNGEGTANMAVYVGKNSKLLFECNVERCKQNAGNQVTKYGAGIMEVTKGKSITDIPTWQLSGGTLRYNGNLATVNLNGATLEGNEKVTITTTLQVAGTVNSTVKNVVFNGTSFQFGANNSTLIADGFDYSPGGTIPSTSSGTIKVMDLTIGDSAGFPSAIGLDVSDASSILRVGSIGWEQACSLCRGKLTAPSGKVKRTVYLGDKVYRTKVQFDSSATPKTMKVFKPGLLFFVQ